MEGWRLGYAIAPKDIVKKIVKFNQITTTCVAPFVQMAGLSCLENEEEIIRQNRNLWKARLEVAEKALTKNGFKFAKPQSGIYVFATRADITDSGEFALSCLEKGVAVSPGGGFGNYKNS